MWLSVCYIGHYGLCLSGQVVVCIVCVTLATMDCVSPWASCCVCYIGHYGLCLSGQVVVCVTLATMGCVSLGKLLCVLHWPLWVVSLWRIGCKLVQAGPGVPDRNNAWGGYAWGGYVHACMVGLFGHPSVKKGVHVCVWTYERAEAGNI